jgi:hypothetical protein
MRWGDKRDLELWHHQVPVARHLHDAIVHDKLELSFVVIELPEVQAT